MRSSRRRALIAASTLLVLARPAAAQLRLPAPEGYVNDFAHVIAPAYADSIRAVIDDVRRKSGGEIVVVTLPSLDGDPIADVALRIGREWKIGRKGQPGDRARGTGVVVLLAMKERAWRIENGTGAETFITAAEAGRIGREGMVPELRAGNVGRALLAGVDSLAAQFAARFHFQLAAGATQAAPEPPPAVAPAPAPAADDPAPATEAHRSGLGLGLLGAAVFILILLAVRYVVRGSRGGELDHWRRNRRWTPRNDRYYDDDVTYRRHGGSLLSELEADRARIGRDTSDAGVGATLDLLFGGGASDGGGSDGGMFDGGSSSDGGSDGGGFDGFGGSGDFSGGGSDGHW
jgi:uncharacterized protein